MDRLDSRLTAYARDRCNLKILYTLVVLALVLGIISMTVGSVAKTEADSIQDTVNHFVENGVLAVDGEVECDSLVFENEFTNSLSDSRIENMPIDTSIWFSTVTTLTNDYVKPDVQIGLIAHRIGDLVSLHVSGWQGTCSNETNILTTKDTIPAEFVPTRGGTYVSSTVTTANMLNNGEYMSGEILVNSNGNVQFFPSADEKVIWGGDCGHDARTITYLIYTDFT